MRNWAAILGGSTLLCAIIAGCIGPSGASDVAPIGLWQATGADAGGGDDPSATPQNPPIAPPVFAASTGGFTALATTVAAAETAPGMIDTIAVEAAATHESAPTNGSADNESAPAALVVEPLEAVDLAAHAIVDALTAVDPLRSLYDAPLDFAQMPQIGILDQCPTVAFVATEDSAAWALAIDFNYRHANSPSQSEPCRDAADGSRAMAGVLGLLHRRGESMTEVVSEHYTIADAPARFSGDCVVTGALGTPIVADGSVVISLGESHAAGALRFEVADADSLAVDGAAVQIRNSDFAVTCEITGLRTRPADYASFVPEQGSLAFALPSGQTVRVTFDASSPGTGVVQVSLNGAPAEPHQVAGLAAE